MSASSCKPSCRSCNCQWISACLSCSANSLCLHSSCATSNCLACSSCCSLSLCFCRCPLCLHSSCATCNCLACSACCSLCLWSLCLHSSCAICNCLPCSACCSLILCSLCLHSSCAICKNCNCLSCSACSSLILSSCRCCRCMAFPLSVCSPFAICPLWTSFKATFWCSPDSKTLFLGLPLPLDPTGISGGRLFILSLQPLIGLSWPPMAKVSFPLKGGITGMGNSKGVSRSSGTWTCGIRWAKSSLKLVCSTACGTAERFDSAEQCPCLLWSSWSVTFEIWDILSTEQVFWCSFSVVEGLSLFVVKIMRSTKLYEVKSKDGLHVERTQICRYFSRPQSIIQKIRLYTDVKEIPK